MNDFISIYNSLTKLAPSWSSSVAVAIIGCILIALCIKYFLKLVIEIVEILNHPMFAKIRSIINNDLNSLLIPRQTFKQPTWFIRGTLYGSVVAFLIFIGGYLFFGFASIVLGGVSLKLSLLFVAYLVMCALFARITLVAAVNSYHKLNGL